MRLCCQHDRNDHGAVKGNVARDLERLDDESSFHELDEIRVEYTKDRSSMHANTVTVDTEFRDYRK